MRTLLITIAALLADVGATRSDASLTWSWGYTQSDVFLQPTESLDAMIQILNDISSTDDLHIGGGLIVLDPSWATYYTFDQGDISAIVLAPGESTTVLYGTFIPIETVPDGTEFDFQSAIFFAPTRGSSELSQEALAPLHVTVIPEPTTIALLCLGSFGACGRRLVRTRAAGR